MTGKHVFHSAVSSDMRVHETETENYQFLQIIISLVMAGKQFCAE